MVVGEAALTLRGTIREAAQIPLSWATRDKAVVVPVNTAAEPMAIRADAGAVALRPLAVAVLATKAEMVAGAVKMQAAVAAGAADRVRMPRPVPADPAAVALRGGCGASVMEATAGATRAVMALTPPIGPVVVAETATQKVGTPLAMGIKGL